jgi:hypothetical protein
MPKSAKTHEIQQIQQNPGQNPAKPSQKPANPAKRPPWISLGKVRPNLNDQKQQNTT